MTPQLPDDLADLRNRVIADWDFAEGMHKTWREQAEGQYRNYRNFKDWRESYTSASPRDRDTVVRDGQATWDAQLYIPYAFSTVETVLSQMLAHRPHMLIQPRDEEAIGNVDNMEFLIDAQQERIRYELVLQDIGKDGLIAGLGWQKIYWDHDVRVRKRVVKRKLPLSIPFGNYAQKRVRETITDDWTAERCEPLDMRWDPYASDVPNCGYIIDRKWRDAKYVAKMVELGIWTLPPGWDLEDLLACGTEQRHYTETFQNRNAASGLPNWAQQSGGRRYEVWEHHDRETVVTLLGREVPVQIGENPCWSGGYPFQAYRPTTAGNGLLPGIGEIEPLEHLIREMNTLRTQRRWAVALAIQKVMAYRAGVVDPDDLKMAPGMLWPVNGDPNELLKEISFTEPPFMAVKEEERLEANIDRTSGVGDPLTGASAAAGTATEAQLVRAAASTRIQNKARRLEVELIECGGNYAVELNQQKILTNRLIKVPLPPEPYEAERRWAWKQVAPHELWGKMAVKVAGGSTMAENIPQDRQDGMQLANLLGGNPNIQQRKLLETVLEKFGIENPQLWLVPEGPRLSPRVLEILAERGVRPDMIEDAVQQAMAEDPTAGQEQGPPPNAAPDPNLEQARAVA